MGKGENEEEQHSSLKGYISSEPIPGGYKLERILSNNGLYQFSVEFLVPIEKDNKEEKSA